MWILQLKLGKLKISFIILWDKRIDTFKNIRIFITGDNGLSHRIDKLHFHQNIEFWFLTQREYSTTSVKQTSVFEIIALISYESIKEEIHSYSKLWYDLRKYISTTIYARLSICVYFIYLFTSISLYISIWAYV